MSDTIDGLSLYEPPWIRELEAPPAQAYEYSWRLARDPAVVVRVLRGQKMRTFQGMFNEFGAVSDYFGENWDALDECLSDLDWLPGRAYVFIFVRATEVLMRNVSFSGCL